MTGWRTAGRRLACVARGAMERYRGSTARGRTVRRMAIDTLVIVTATGLAVTLTSSLLEPAAVAVLWLLAGSALQLGFLVSTGVHRASFHATSFGDVRRLTLIVMGGTTAATVLAVAARTGPYDAAVPSPLGVEAVFLPLSGTLTLLGLLTVRGVTRTLHERYRHPEVERRPGRRVLVAGAGEAGTLLVRTMQRHPEAGRMPVGFVDDDAVKLGSRLAGVEVLGSLDAIPEIVARERVDEVVIALPSADGHAVRRVVDAVRRADASVARRIIPPLHELVSGKASIDRVRDVDIDDLLRRPPVVLDEDRIREHLRGRRVLVTGAGGSIGSELVQHICRFAPREVLLLGRGENSIFQLERQLDQRWPEVRTRSVIGAVQHTKRLDHVMDAFQPDVVFHAAAHKHVPLMEANPEEAVFNNVLGSRNLLRAALRVGVRTFVNVSTDKAVAPTSVMGASKRLVEQLVLDAASRARESDVFASVRFGNVLGSRGSVVPTFRSQIAAGGPVTVTHPDMVRYFMTIPEAAQLVLQAAATGRNGSTYVLDMGEPVRVVDLARDLIRLSGLEPDVDVEIAFLGSRPGEKLREELADEGTLQVATRHEKIFVTHPAKPDRGDLAWRVDALEDAALRSDGREIRRLLGLPVDGVASAGGVQVEDQEFGRAVPA